MSQTDPNDIYHNGVFYNRNGNGGVAGYAMDTNGNVVGFNGSANTLAFDPAYGVICAAFGDSITAQNTNLSGTVSYMYSNGYMTWASILSGGKIFFSAALNYGVAGDTTTLMVARLATSIASAKALGARFVVILAGTNDNYGGVTYAQTIANLANIYGAWLGAGITPIIIPITPRAKDAASGSMLTADRQKMQRVITWQRGYCRDNPSVLIADATLNITDHSVTNGDPIGALLANSTASTTDGLHLAARGSFWTGKAIVDAVQYYLRGISQMIWSQADTHDITNNPTGNLLANGFMTGTGGTPGTGASGSLATSFTFRRQAGSTITVVGSKGTTATANGSTYPNQRIAVAGAGSGAATETAQVYQQVFPSGTTYAVGDTVYAECAISVSGVTAATLKSIYLKCQDDGFDARIGQISGPGYLPDQSWSGVLRTPSFVIKAGTTAITTSLNADLDGTIACGVTIDIERITTRKVI